MALSFNYATQVIGVPQADLTNISGTLFELDTDQFRKDLASEQDSARGMPFIDMYIHNTAVTVAGTTFAQTLEIINGYTIEFTPDAQYSVRLEGSNNNIFDVDGGILVQNQVQLIAQNSAGLITTGGGGLSAPQVAAAVWDASITSHATAATFGERVGKKLLDFAKWIALKDD